LSQYQLNLWKDKKFLQTFFISFLFLVIVLLALTKFVVFIEQRNGFSFNDPILKLFSPIDLTWLIFSVIYLSLILGIIHLIRFPKYLLIAIQSYSLLILFRTLFMFLLPLNPPEKMILLKDPFVEFFSSNGIILTKDLFFSGHTATMFLLFLTARENFYKITFLIATFIIAASVLIQQVHYTIDVITAPFVTYCAYSIIIYLNKHHCHQDIPLLHLLLEIQWLKSIIISSGNLVGIQLLH